MTFSELFTSALLESAPKEDATRQKRASKATDLGPYAQAVWSAKGLDAKKAKALAFVSHMTAGKQPQHRANVEKASTEAAIDKLVSNIMLSGEGKSVM